MDKLAKNDLAELANQINIEHANCMGAMRESLEYAVKAGELLIQVKALVPHGEWLPWLAANCEVPERTTQAYMRIARNWPELSKSATVADLTVRGALILLEAPKSESPEAILPISQVLSYVEELERKADQAKTLDDIKKVDKEYHALNRLRKRAFEKVEAKIFQLESERDLAAFDRLPIDTTTPVGRVMPLEWLSGKLDPPPGWEDIFWGVNMWQKNFCGWCAELGCRQPIENKAEWGTHHGRLGWSTWGLEALGPPRKNWQPVFCELHNNDNDWAKIIDLTRKFLSVDHFPPSCIEEEELDFEPVAA